MLTREDKKVNEKYLKKVTTDLFWAQAVSDPSEKGSLNRFGIELAERKAEEK
jgi:hypothetical protein